MGIQGLSYNVLGMQVSQAGLRVANHNIANSTTTNYSRKLLLQNTVVAQDVALKKIATGVKVEDVIRAKNNFLDNQYRDNLQQQAFFEKLEAINSQMTSILGEPSDQLLVKNLQDFYINKILGLMVMKRYPNILIQNQFQRQLYHLL